MGRLLPLLRRPFRITTRLALILSTLLFIATTILWIAALWKPLYWSFGDRQADGLHGWVACQDGNVQFYSKRIQIVSPSTTPSRKPIGQPEIPVDFLGLTIEREELMMIRLVPMRSEILRVRQFGLQVPLWMPLVVSVFFPVGWMLMVRHWSSRQLQREARCLHCGYDLRATPNRCPECGHPAATAQVPDAR